MRIVVTGSRGWTDTRAIHNRLLRCPEGTVIVHGAARGADRIVDQQARMLGIAVEAHPADWKAFPKRAGLKRNIEMLEAGADLVLAFWDGESTGTSHCITEARRRGIPVEVVMA